MSMGRAVELGVLSYGDFSLFDSFPYGVLAVDVFNRLTYYNREAELLFGVDEGQETFIQYEQVLKGALYYNELVGDPRQTTYSNHLIYNGREYIYDLAPVYIAKRLRYKIIIIRDRASLPELEQEMHSLKRENYILKKIIDSSYDGIYITDGEGKTLYFNDSFVRMSGFKREETVGVTTKELVERGYLPKSCSMEVIKQRKAVSMTIDYHNGIEAMLSGNPVFDENGNLIRTILNVRDMTELNRLNSELKDATALTATYRQQLREVQSEYQRTCKIVSQSKTMKNVIDLGIKASSVDSPVLILGESGCGKDVIAKFIHNVGERAKKGDLVKINCGAIPENLLESELFGYEAGAFTGAKNQGKVGLFELADGGTFFLDEIGDMPLNLQVKLLDVLQEGTITRIGGTKPIPINARVIAATNKDLEQMVKENKFRLDLFYRLNVISITIPPLRERPEDIIPLLEQTLENCNERYKMKKKLSPQALNQLISYSWPGNIRELKNIIERVVVIAEENLIKPEHLPVQISPVSSLIDNDCQGESNVPTLQGTLKETMARVEKQVIQECLGKQKSLKDAAQTLGVDLSTLVRKKQKYNL